MIHNTSHIDVLQVGTTLAKRARSARKRAHRPLSTGHPLSDSDRRAALLQELEHLHTLPPASTYARHRRRVVNKALLLLDMYEESRIILSCC